MSPSSHGKAEKGSQFHLQEFVNKKSELLNAMILTASPSLIAFDSAKPHLEWRSPLSQSEVKGEFYEYRDDFLEALDLEDHQHSLRDFWPKNGPQWDGLAKVSAGGKTGYLLVEAKAHPKETFSDMQAKAPQSIETITAAFNETQSYMGVEGADWTKKHYQLANRLAFLYFMNVKLKLPTWLLLINFVGDMTHKSTELDQWLDEYAQIFADMSIDSSCRLIDKVITVFPDVSEN